jgi:uncharacterized protein (DUF1800 family)
MKTSLMSWAKTYFVRTLPLLILVIVSGAVSSAAASNPILISNATSTRAVAFESVTQRPEPFKLTSSTDFTSGVDNRTRVEIFAMNLDVLAGESIKAFSAEAQDAANIRYPLTVEYVGQVPSFDGIYMIVVRLNDSMTTSLGDVLIRLSLHGASSNRVRIAIGTTGGGPPDDAGAVPTPAPLVPPAGVTPLTIAQYRAQFNDPAFPSAQDRLRFLEQTTWGPSDADITHLQQVGMAAWINEQFAAPFAFPSVFSNYPAITPYPQFYPASPPAPACDAICQRDNYTLYPLQKQFMVNAIGGGDQLRQRVAFALHKVIVVGGAPLNNNQTYWYAPYLQTIDKNAFGNFRDLLYEVTLNPGMGEYLNMRGNSVVNRANPTPNENYAREIMQLFSIGVDMLNQDGTPILDAQGEKVPSYDQNTIANLARVFTGWDLAPNKVWSVDGTTAVTNYSDPMVPNGNRNRYDIAAKTLLPDINHASPFVVPACANCTTGTTAQQTAATQAYAVDSLGGNALHPNGVIDNLFNHPNVGPYLCTQLIHQMVTSNPTPPYVGRCSAAFADNGAGVRGDMKAVITAILLDPEARGDFKTDPNYGHLREPVLLMTHLLRTFNAVTDGVLVTNSPNSYSNDMGQNIFNPPTVFSYFPSDFGLPGTTLFGPEYGLLDTSTTYKRANFMNTLFLANSGNGIPANGVNRPTGTQLNISAYTALATTPSTLVDALDARLMHSTMSASMKANIVTTVTGITNANATTQALQRTQTAIYLIATSAQYQVER